MMPAITGLSSMATRLLLADVAEAVARDHGIEVAFTSGGGVAIAQQIRDGAAADVAVLAADALASLDDVGLLVPGSRRPLYLSPVVAAVPGAGASVALETEDDLRGLLTAATRIAYSTGPSGNALLALLERWGIDVDGRLVQARPGVPVGSLLADGEADLGFQQASELLPLSGITVLGPLPGDAAITSTFSGAVLASSAHPDVAATVLALLDADADLVARHGMDVA